MRSTFWPNRICERQRFQRRHTSLKVSSKRENGALSMKIVLNALFRLCAARFGQIAFVCVKVLKIVKLAWNALQTGKTVRLPWKLYKTIFSGYTKHVWAKSHFRASKFSKSSHWPEILSKKVKQCACHRNCTKRSFLVMRSTFWPNRISERLFLKILKLASNSPQNGKTVRFPWKLYKALLSGYAQQVLAKSHFRASKFTKLWNWPETLFKPGKQCVFHENCTNPAFQVMRSTFWPNRIFWASKLLKSLHLSQILFKRRKQCAFHENCTKRSF